MRFTYPSLFVTESLELGKNARILKDGVEFSFHQPLNETNRTETLDVFYLSTDRQNLASSITTTPFQKGIYHTTIFIGLLDPDTKAAGTFVQRVSYKNLSGVLEPVGEPICESFMDEQFLEKVCVDVIPEQESLNVKVEQASCICSVAWTVQISNVAF